MTTDDPRYAKARRHPLRARILASLGERQATPTQLASDLGASVGTVAYHVRTLHSLGLIELVGETRVRGAVAHHYRAVASTEPSAEQDATASAQEQVAELAESLQAINCARVAADEGGFDRDGTHATSKKLELDSQGWVQLASACSGLLAQIDHIQREAADRVTAKSNGAVKAGLVLLLFESGAVS